MFEEGAVERLIINALARALEFTLKRAQIIDETKLTKSQIHNALYRMRLKGLLVNRTVDPNMPYGYWRLRKLYRKLRHTKRIVETRQKSKKRSWNADCEATSEGFVPYTGLPVPPDRPPSNITEAYGSVVNPKLVYEMMRILGINGIVLTDAETSFETVDNPKHHVPEFSIAGTEWLDELSATFDPVHKVEVFFTNDRGVLYSPYQGAGTWSGRFIVSEDEFE